MAYDDPRWMGGLGMIGTKAVYHAVQNCDLLLMIGTDYPYSNVLPTKGTVIQIDERPQVLGRRAPTALGVTSDLEAIARARRGQDRRQVLGQGHPRAPEMGCDAGPAIRSQAEQGRIHPQAVARAVSDAARHDAIFVLDT